MATDEILASLGIDQLIAADSIGRDEEGRLVDSMGARVVLAAAESARGFHRVLAAEETGAWNVAMKAGGHGCGQKIAARLDATLTGMGKPVLSALPIEACLTLLEHHFATHGWGRLKLDLAEAAEHGIVVARLEHSYFVETLADVDDFVDPLLAGILQGFFEHFSGQNLGCEEIACARCGAAHCTFVLTAPERLASITPLIGRESADALLARLRQ